MEDISVTDLIQSFYQTPATFDEGEEQARLAVDALSHQFAPAEGVSVRESNLGELNAELAVFDEDGPIVSLTDGSIRCTRCEVPGTGPLPNVPAKLPRSWINFGSIHEVSAVHL